jgi:hypothetical protein
MNEVAKLSHSPELIARLLMFSYFGAYPAKTWQRLHPHTPTIDEVLKQAWQGPQDTYQEPEYIVFDAPLHLKMAVLGDYYGMHDLMKYSIRRLWLAMVPEFEQVGEKTLEVLEEVWEEVDNLEDEHLNGILAAFLKLERIVYREKETKARLGRLVEVWPELEQIRLVKAKPVKVAELEPWDAVVGGEEEGEGLVIGEEQR